MSKVRWVVGRRKAIARALAMSSAEAKGLRWFDLPTQTRDSLVRDADEVVGSWVSDGLLAEFRHDYREKE